MKTYKKTTSKYKLIKEKTDFPSAKITSSLDAEKFIRQFYGSDIDIYESFYLLMLNRANNTEGFIKLSSGGTASSIVDIKLLCKYCVDSLASAVILAHNHPSGNTKPSDNDIKVTEKVKEALRVFDITVIDHLILVPIIDNEKNYLSFADENLL